MDAQSTRVKVHLGPMYGDETLEKEHCTRYYQISGGKVRQSKLF